MQPCWIKVLISLRKKKTYFNFPQIVLIHLNFSSNCCDFNILLCFIFKVKNAKTQHFHQWSDFGAVLQSMLSLCCLMHWFGFVSVWFSVFFRKQICHAGWQRSRQRKAIWPAEKRTISTEHWERYAKVSSAHTHTSFFCGVLKSLSDTEVQFSS